MARHGKCRLLGREQGRGNIIAGPEPTAVGKLDAGLHADDRGCVGEAIPSGEAPVAVEPINVLNDADGPLFDAAMALVVVGEAVEAIRDDGEGKLMAEAPESEPREQNMLCLPIP
jgi:hypothetical protein